MWSRIAPVSLRVHGLVKASFHGVMDSAPQASFHGVVDSACGNAREHMKYTWTSFSLLFVLTIFHFVCRWLPWQIFGTPPPLRGAKKWAKMHQGRRQLSWWPQRWRVKQIWRRGTSRTTRRFAAMVSLARRRSTRKWREIFAAAFVRRWLLFQRSTRKRWNV